MQGNVFLFVPNIIDYARGVLVIFSFWVMFSHPWLAFAAHFTSSLLDEFDGSVARRLDQCSLFGGQLDMVLDRITAIGLLVALAQLYKSYLFLFQFLITLDIFSHFIQMYCRLIEGGTDHKTDVSDLSLNPIMRFFYTPSNLRVFCVGDELFFISMYMVYFMPNFAARVLGVGLWKIMAAISFPIAAGKHGVHLVQFVVACLTLARLDSKERLKSQ